VSLNLVELPQTDLRDIALQMRRMADWVEKSGRSELSCIFVLGNGDGSVNVYGWGTRVSALEAAGWLARAQAKTAEPVERIGTEAG